MIISISKITDNIFLGDFHFIKSTKVEDMHKLGITHVFNLSAPISVHNLELIKFVESKSGINYIHRPMPSDPFKDPKQFKKILESLVSELISVLSNPNNKIFVHCIYGMDRAPLAVSMVISKLRNIPLLEAYRIVKRIKPIVNIHLDWIDVMDLK